MLQPSSKLMAVLLPWLAHAQTLRTACRFTGGNDGAQPRGALLYYRGALFGATLAGGAAGQGTVFPIDPASGAQTVLHGFAGGADGSNPADGLIPQGGLRYGSTTAGRKFQAGTVFT